MKVVLRLEKPLNREEYDAALAANDQGLLWAHIHAVNDEILRDQYRLVSVPIHVRTAADFTNDQVLHVAPPLPVPIRELREAERAEEELEELIEEEPTEEEPTEEVSTEEVSTEEEPPMPDADEPPPMCAKPNCKRRARAAKGSQLRVYCTKHRR